MKKGTGKGEAFPAAYCISGTVGGVFAATVPHGAQGKDLCTDRSSLPWPCGQSAGKVHSARGKGPDRAAWARPAFGMVYKPAGRRVPECAAGDGL